MTEEEENKVTKMCVRDIYVFLKVADNPEFQCPNSTDPDEILICSLLCVMINGVRKYLEYFIFDEIKYIDNRVLVMRPIDAVDGSLDIHLDVGGCECPYQF